MKKKILMFVFMLSLVLSVPVYAADFDFSGVFARDNDVVRLSFTVGESSNVAVFSSSWFAGGFDMMLGIWTSGGALMAFQDDGGVVGETMSNGILYSHGVWDSYYNVSLAPGNYIATVTQYDNFNVGNSLSQGFRYDGDENFTFGYNGGTQTYFNGVYSSPDPRTGNWAFHLLNVEQASVVPAVPEPASMLLLGLGLMGLAGYRRMKR